MHAVDEAGYDRRRLSQRTVGRVEGLSRRDLLRALAGAGVAAAGLSVALAVPASAVGPIVKPLPPELFDDLAPVRRTHRVWGQ